MSVTPGTACQCCSIDGIGLEALFCFPCMFGAMVKSVYTAQGGKTQPCYPICPFPCMHPCINACLDKSSKHGCLPFLDTCCTCCMSKKSFMTDDGRLNSADNISRCYYPHICCLGASFLIPFTGCYKMGAINDGMEFGEANCCGIKSWSNFCTGFFCCPCMVPYVYQYELEQGDNHQLWDNYSNTCCGAPGCCSGNGG